MNSFSVKHNLLSRLWGYDVNPSLSSILLGYGNPTNPPPNKKTKLSEEEQDPLERQIAEWKKQGYNEDAIRKMVYDWKRERVLANSGALVISIAETIGNEGSKVNPSSGYKITQEDINSIRTSLIKLISAVILALAPTQSDYEYILSKVFHNMIVNATLPYMEAADTVNKERIEQGKYKVYRDTGVITKKDQRRLDNMSEEERDEEISRLEELDPWGDWLKERIEAADYMENFDIRRYLYRPNIKDVLRPIITFILETFLAFSPDMSDFTTQLDKFMTKITWDAEAKMKQFSDNLEDTVEEDYLDLHPELRRDEEEEEYDDEGDVGDEGDFE